MKPLCAMGPQLPCVVVFGGHLSSFITAISLGKTAEMPEFVHDHHAVTGVTGVQAGGTPHLTCCCKGRPPTAVHRPPWFLV